MSSPLWVLVHGVATSDALLAAWLLLVLVPALLASVAALCVVDSVFANGDEICSGRSPWVQNASILAMTRPGQCVTIPGDLSSRFDGFTTAGLGFFFLASSFALRTFSTRFGNTAG